MKTTIELPDDLLMEAKTLAVRRKTTLKALMESALRREIRPSAASENPDPEKYEVGPFGILSIKKREGGNTVEESQRLVDHQYEEEDAPILAMLAQNP